MAFGLIYAAVGIAIAGIVIGAVAIPILNEVNTTGWSSINSTIWPYITTFLILSLLVGSMAGVLLRGGP